MKFPNLFRRGALVTTVLIAVFVLATLLVNLPLFDEELEPDVVSILQPTQVPPHAGNAYFAFLGMTAAADKDIADTGVRLVERYRRNRESSGLDALTSEDYAEISGATGLDDVWVEKFQRCTARTTYGCLAKYRADLQDTPINNQRLLLMMERQQRILKMPAFKRWTGNSSMAPLPPYGMIMKLSQLKLASSYEPDSSANFLSQVAVDIRFWRMLLGQGSLLIDKMVAVAGIWTDVQYLSEYLTTHELSADEARFVQSLLKPLTRRELDIADAFKSEHRALLQMLTTAAGAKSRSAFGPLVRGWLMQTNATQNSYYQHITEPMLRLSSLSRAEFATTVENRAQQNGDSRKAYSRDAVDSLITIWPGSLYNLGGKILISNILGHPEDYIARVHDVNRMIELVKLQLSLQSEQVESVDDFLHRRKSANSNSNEAPVNNVLDFDFKDGWLQFDCLDKPSLCKIRLRN